MKLRIVVSVAVAAFMLLGLAAIFRLPWVQHRGEGVSANVKKWFAPAPQPTLLVAADLDCDWKLDGKTQGHLRADEIFTLITTPGQHLVEAKTTDGRDEWRGVVEVHAPEQRVAAIGLDPIRQERLTKEKTAELEHSASQNAQAAKRIAIENQAAIERAAESTTRASRNAASAAAAAARVTRRDAALRELRGERTMITAEDSSSGYRKTDAERQAVQGARLKLSCPAFAQASHELLEAAGLYSFSLSWKLAESSVDHVTCDEDKLNPGSSYHRCVAYVKGSCQLVGRGLTGSPF